MSVFDIKDDEAGGWAREARCLGAPTDVFFPEGDNRGAAAKRICRACPVRTECLEANLTVQHGVFGGLTANERLRLRTGPRPRAIPTRPFDPSLCGTTKGHTQHQLFRLEPCRACKDAKNARRRQLRAEKAAA